MQPIERCRLLISDGQAQRQSFCLGPLRSYCWVGIGRSGLLVVAHLLRQARAHTHACTHMHVHTHNHSVWDPCRQSINVVTHLILTQPKTTKIHQLCVSMNHRQPSRDNKLRYSSSTFPRTEELSCTFSGVLGDIKLPYKSFTLPRTEELSCTVSGGGQGLLELGSDT